jgi:hypothetical protein
VPPIDIGLFRAAGRRWEGALDTTLRSSVVPYGYTVTIWASGAYLIHLQGTPSMGQAFLFVSGALLAFAALAAFSHGRAVSAPAPAGKLHPDAAHPILAAGLHITAVGIALFAAGVIDRGTGEAAWLLGSFAVTFIYLGTASGELALALELQRREIGIYSARLRTRRRRDAVRSGALPDRRSRPENRATAADGDGRREDGGRGGETGRERERETALR